jgi:hypothetical protein
MTSGMTIAYLILAHRFPQQLARQIDRLPDQSPIFIHFDGRANPDDWKIVESIAAERSNVRLVKRHSCYWGSYGIAAGTVELVWGLVDSGLPFDYAVLLSGSDYPIKSNVEIDRFLTAHAGQEHIECFSLQSKNRWDNDTGPMAGLRRYQSYFLRYRSRIVRIPANRRPPLGLPLFGGTQWWALSANCIRYCAQFLREQPRFLRFFKTTAIPDEAVFQTIIGNSPFARTITGKEPTMSIWNRPQPPYPATLVETDWDELAASPFLFARKFDPVQSKGLMDRLDAANAETEFA